MSWNSFKMGEKDRHIEREGGKEGGERKGGTKGETPVYVFLI